MFVRRRIAEEDEFGIPETADDEAIVAIDCLCDAALKGYDRFAHVFETNAVGSRRDADQFARHGSDLAAFGAVMQCWRGVPRRVDPGRQRYNGYLRFGEDRPDESIAAAGQGFDPTVAAGGLAEHPAQRRDLSRKVAFLDCPAGPRGFEQRVLRNQCAGPFNQGLQQGDRSAAERYGLAIAEQQMGLGVQAKRSQRMDRHHDSF
jgi:hypothetical protein